MRLLRDVLAVERTIVVRVVVRIEGVPPSDVQVMQSSGYLMPRSRRWS